MAAVAVGAIAWMPTAVAAVVTTKSRRLGFETFMAFSTDYQRARAEGESLTVQKPLEEASGMTRTIPIRALYRTRDRGTSGFELDRFLPWRTQLLPALPMPVEVPLADLAFPLSANSKGDTSGKALRRLFAGPFLRSFGYPSLHGCVCSTTRAAARG